MAQRKRGTVLQKGRKFQHYNRRVQEQQRRLYAIIGGVVAVVVLLVVAGLVWQYVLLPKRPVAKVNGEPITMHQFQVRVRVERMTLINQVNYYLTFLQLFGDQPEMLGQFVPQLQTLLTRLNDAEALGEQVLDVMVDEALIVQEARQRGIEVTDAEVEKAIQEAFGYYAAGTPTPEPTRTPWPTSTLSATQMALLGPTATPTATATPNAEATPTAAASPTAQASPTPRPTATPFTQEAYQQRLDEWLAQAGISYDDLKAVMRVQLYRQKLMDVVTADVPTTEEQVWARHILVEDEATAQEVLEKLKAGEDFAALAETYSQDPGSAAQGGDLGWFGRGMMVKPFEDAAFSLQVGEISPPVQTDFGWHIIQVLGHEERPMTTTQIENAKDQAFREWLQQVRDQADIETYDLWRKYVPTEPDLSPQLKAQLQQFLLSMQQPQPPALPTPAGGTSTDGQNQP